MNTIFIDLDGTMLPMDQNKFVEIYFHSLAQKCIPLGFDTDALIKGVWAGTKAMILNDGTVKNEVRFWDTFASLFGEEVRKLEPYFNDFYRNEFNQAMEAANPTPLANKCIQLLKDKGYGLVLATNPIFPQVATYTRMRWAGIHPDDFELVTTYENSYYCKPNLEYYKAILKRIGKKPEECMMIGNDVKEDMCTIKLGMKTFLLSDCLIENTEEAYKAHQVGSFEEFYDYIQKLGNAN